MAFRTHWAAAAVAGALLLAMAAAGQAQTARDAGEAPAGRELKVTEEKLAAFVGAAVAVERVGADWRPKVDGAASEAEKQRLVESAHAEMREAVEAAPGISLEEYAAIATAAQKDPELGQKLTARIREAKDGGG